MIKKIVDLFKGLGKLILLLGALVGFVILMILCGVIYFGAWGLIMEFIGFIGNLLNNWWVFGSIIFIAILYGIVSDKVNSEKEETKNKM